MSIIVLYNLYSGVLINGALQAFSTYAQEVEAARWVGIASAIVDIPSLLNNRYWLGNRRLAVLAATNGVLWGLKWLSTAINTP
ncbi:MAG: hypothetical protein GU356_03570 [Pyrobaculum sp.]|jgi:hypothetical protein|nr:hypothetical protein [Pyrobaculum sp.]